MLDQSECDSPPLPFLPPSASPLARTRTPILGQSPGGGWGKEAKLQPGSCYKLWRDSVLASCKPRALLIPLPRQHVALSLHPKALKS